MAINDVYRATILYGDGSSRFQTSHYFRMKTAADPDGTKGLVLANAMKELMRGIQGDQVIYDGWTLEQVFGGTVVYQQSPTCKKTGGLILAGAPTGTLTGGDVGGDPLPAQNSCVLTLGTAFAGRSKRGRTYVMGITETNQGNGLWLSGVASYFTTALTTYLGLFAGTGTNPDFRFGVWSTVTATGCRVNPLTGLHVVFSTPSPQTAFEPVTTVVQRPIVYTQRRRTIGVGR